MGKLSAAVTATVLVALAAATTASPWARQATIEQRATALTGQSPAIVCETPLEHAQGVKAGGTGYHAFTLAGRPRLVVLSPSICQTLRRGEPGSAAFAHAVYVLAHELGHVVLRTKDETAAECYALARWRDLAARFGVTAPTAEQSAGVTAAHDRLPARYRGSCP